MNKLILICAALLTSLIFLTGCEHLHAQTETVAERRIKETPPYRAEYTRILKKKYILNVYDCSNKSAEYVTILREYGNLDADIIIVDDNEDDGMTHAIVRVKYEDGTVLYVDPTNDWYDTNMERHGWYFLMEVPYEYMYDEHWFRFYTDRGEFDFDGMEAYHKIHKGEKHEEKVVRN
jgi:hypothetical protein